MSSQRNEEQQEAKEIETTDSSPARRKRLRIRRRMKVDKKAEKAPSGGGSQHATGARILRILALLIGAAGCLAAGAAVGWWIRDAQNEALAPIAVEAVIDRPVTVAGASDTALGHMPGVLGLPLDQARYVLFNSGVAAGAITVTQRPTALEPGLVVLQEPEAGSALADAVSLVVSTEALVPDVAGMPLEEAEAVLADLGASPTVQRQSNSGAQPGIVVSTEPAAGETLGRSIVLHVSAS